jgi:RNA polymerase sigma-70 factor (ECF subfamily)
MRLDTGRCAGRSLSQECKDVPRVSAGASVQQPAERGVDRRESSFRERHHATAEDGQDFGPLYKEFQPRVRRYVARLVGASDAEDVTQQVFLKVSQALPDFRGDSALSTWIWRIAANTATDC